MSAPLAPGIELGVLQGPLLLFGGPYSNLAATQAIRLEAERRAIPARQVICTGDVVAYCARPAQVVELIRDWGCHVVQGNCEESLGADADDCGCGFSEGSTCALLSQGWYAFARRRLNQDQRDWMRRLPGSLGFTLAGRRVVVVHGAVSSINKFVFASTDNDQKQRELALTDADVLIGGHCGIPFGQPVGKHWWLNSGAIGMPANEGCPGGWYLLIEPAPAGLQVSWHRLDYDPAADIAAMRAAGLTEGYHRTLEEGLWPSMGVLPVAERQLAGVALTPPALTISRA